MNHIFNIMSRTLNALNQIIDDGHRRNLVHNFTQDDEFGTNADVTINGDRLVNFGSCSYLGLENEEKLKQGVIDAVTKFGTQFSTSRTYLSLGLYQELESLLRQIFEKPLIATASTTLGHLAAIPVVVGEKDAVILDLQAHSSIQMTIQILKSKKIPIFIIDHNSMDSLEKKIQSLNNDYEKIWYFADGVYSMYGDFAPFKKLEELLNKYKKFHLYIDDAHGMGWTGKNGFGVVRSHMAHHEKMVLAVSLNKSFGAAGGCIVFPNEELATKVRNCGSTYIFSGPIQPPMLGAACASARLHLSDDIKQRQSKLQELINFTNQRLDNLNLPQFMKTNSPLFFIPVGLPKITYDIVHYMKEDGFYVNTASFPAVPMRKSGIRFMINYNLSIDEINDMLTCLSKNYLKALSMAGSDCSYVARIFGIPEFNVSTNDTEQKEVLQFELERSISSQKKTDWNDYFANNGNLDYDNIALIEKTFSDQALPENNWDFYYLTVKDKLGKIVLKTFFTVALVKDDMLSPGYISEKVEKARLDNPYYLTSKNVVSGAFITKGEQIFFDKNHDQWKEALKILVEQMQIVLNESEATNIMLRDFFDKQDADFESYLLELGLIKYPLLKNYIVDDLRWETTDDFLSSLGGKYRYNVRKEILKYEDQFLVDYDKPTTTEEKQTYYELYENVFDSAFDLNVFKLPYDYFEAMYSNPNYDIIKLYLKPEFTDGESTDKPILVGVLFSYINQSKYNALIVGLDYQYVRTHNTYKQILYQTLLRARQLGCQELDLAYTADLEKKKLGAKAQEVYAYVQAAELFNFHVLESIS